MIEAVPAQATGVFHERPVASPLRESFSCVWVHRMTEAGTPPIIVMPDGTIDLQWVDGTFRVAGPDREPQTEIVPAGASIIGFRFHPAAAAAWFGMPVSDLVGLRLPLEDLWGRKARRLAQSVRGGEGGTGLIASLEETIARHAVAQHRPTRPIDAPMRAAYGLIAQGPPPGAPLVPWLMRALAMSERTLRRRFDESFGYGPKTLDRILRYQRFLRLSRESNESAAVLAAEAGYADQAHLVRESRRLTSATPLQFQRMVSADRTSDPR